MVIDFYATWCPPCRSAAPVFEAWSKQFKKSEFVFAKVNVDSAKEVARKYSIRGMPTFKILDSNGNEIKSFVGWRRNEIETFLSEKAK